MEKMVFLMAKKPGLSRAAFIHRYEARHVPLALDIIPYMDEYRRTYLPTSEPVASGPEALGAPRLPFDVITELWFEDHSAVEALFADLGGSGKGEQLARDESEQFDRDKMLMMAVDERITDSAGLAPAPTPDAMPAVKLIAFLGRREGVTQEAFIGWCERGHVEAALLSAAHEDGRNLLAGCSRNYPRLGTTAQFGADGAPPFVWPFDAMVCLWFWTRDDYDRFRISLKDSVEVQRLIADAADLIDVTEVLLFVGEERVTSQATCAAARATMIETDR